MTIRAQTVPVCLPCWRVALGHMDDDPLRRAGWPEEFCVLCGRRTNHGIYVDPSTMSGGSNEEDA